MNIQVVILNGPAGSGKDDLADHIIKTIKRDLSEDDLHEPVTHCQFKHHLYIETAKLFNVSLKRIKELLQRETKEVVTSELTLDGVQYSPRQAMIHTSEWYIKPMYGKDYFGRKTARDLQPGLNIFTDGGFLEELIPVCGMAEPDNVLILQIDRPGYTFEGDSRDYISKDDLIKSGISWVSLDKIKNDASLVEFRKEGLKRVMDFVKFRQNAFQLKSLGKKRRDL